ncbi:MAG: TIGR03087 family PEP-CTERM/XrtA system glycosyltransferase [Rhodocyclaceae bacterium]
MKPPLLYLVHRIPYPPNKGDKVRSFNLLRHLARDYRVFLATFVDDAADHAHVPALDDWCAGVLALPLSRRSARLGSLTGLLSGQALSLPYYRSRRMHRWVADTVRREKITRAVVYSSSMAQYIEPFPHLRSVVDFVDVDSAKWARYADDHRGAMGWLYRREGRCLADYECRMAAWADASVLVSEAEADLLRHMAPSSRERIYGISNGVDAEFFSPAHALPSPYAAGERAVVFTGAMDYWPNIDAVCGFADEVWPRLLAAQPDLRFYIVGMNPSDAVKALGRRTGIEVTGRVPDVRPYLAHAGCVVAPLKVARGIQNKVLEAMAMARPVVASNDAAVGIEARAGRELLIADTADDMLAAIADVLTGQHAELGAQARARVLADYSWSAHLSRFNALIEGRPAFMPALAEAFA